MSDAVIGARVVTTRKKHRCFGCDREFPEGSKMERSCLINDAMMSTCYLCETCLLLMQEIEPPDGAFKYGELREEAIQREEMEKDP